MELKDTLNLPDTKFPMRGNLVKREPSRLEHWRQMGLYEKIQEQNAQGPSFVLHDGPPFTNGDVHIGTALNKILKDSILRYKSMQGFRAPYVPGWDCHGLPIEFKVTKELREKGEDLSPAQLREACAEFSASFIEKQRGQFQRLGVLADWAEEYKTMKPTYEATILRTFASFVEQGLVYRSKKPVYWSIPCETALAEAEVEYHDHVSPSIWVRFEIPGHQFLHIDGPLYIVIWTTTPWTLPANLAVAVHPDLEYVEVKHNGATYLVVAQLAENFIESCELEGATLGEKHLGRKLESLQPNHPFIERKSPVVLADYVTTESGTGCVHTAPGHGLEDYLTGLKYGLDIYCPLDDNGCYVDDGQVPAELVGVTVLETKGKCPANSAVLSILTEKGALMAVKKHEHSYPHCWRSKTPVVFRAMDQWFVSLDAHHMREKVLEQIEQVKWTPEAGIKRIRGAVETRPDWCISRQRSWGVPIPVFYDEDKNPLIDSDVIKALADKVAEHGTNIWFEQSAAELLDGIELPAEFAGKTLTKGGDTLDVWIDSGCSHRAVLQQNEKLSWPADLYLEGSDQHRGWFQSSIWTGVIADGAAPYKEVVTHGFIVNEKGEKESKSKGAMSSDGWVKKFGADIMRLWVASQDYRGDIRLSENHFKLVSNVYRGVRNTLMYQLGNLAGFNYETDAVKPADLTPIDQWALMQTAGFVERVTTAMDNYEFHRAYQEIDRFVGVTLSRVYHAILKDRLYTFAPEWTERASSQTAIYLIFRALVRVIAPVLTFTADEAWSFHVSGEELADDSIHLQAWPKASDFPFDAQVAADIDAVINFREEQVNLPLEKLREEKVIGANLEAKVSITATEEDPLLKLLTKYEADLPELFIVSQVTLATKTDGEVEITAAHADGERCPRSWRWVEELVPAGDFGNVSPRDRDALKALNLI
ncbi:isoleucine--tRNA ligase [Cerasicoccus frondis]|uniref:isoleucine--tRNA ligase n=1 Tax=Cerasicoccus frondis TaxID=490090 RepID=UPI002852A1DF|nr:isoleucine--tRNA ligase [Cerasicoccus frondis]